MATLPWAKRAWESATFLPVFTAAPSRTRRAKVSRKATTASLSTFTPLALPARPFSLLHQ